MRANKKKLFCFWLLSIGQVYNAYQELLKGLASMLQVFHGIPKNSAMDAVDNGHHDMDDDDESNVYEQQLLSIFIFCLSVATSLYCFIRSGKYWIGLCNHNSAFRMALCPGILLFLSVLGIFFFIIAAFSSGAGNI